MKSKIQSISTEKGTIRKKYCIHAWNKLEKIFNHFPNKPEETLANSFYYLEKDEISIFEKYYCLRNKIDKGHACQKYDIPIETKGTFYFYQYIDQRTLSCRQYLLLLQKRTIIWKKQLDMPFQEFYYDN